MTYRFINFVRLIFFLLAAYLICHVLFFAGMKMYDSNSNNYNIAAAIFYYVVFYLFPLTIAYIIAEFVIFKRNKNNPTKVVPKEASKNTVLFIAYTYFLIYSFVKFLTALNLISSNFYYILVFNTIFNLIPIYVIYRLLIKNRY